MKNKLTAAMLIITAGTMVSCGNDKKPSKSKSQLAATTFTDKVPVRLIKQVAKENCPYLFREGTEAKFFIPQFLEGKLVDRELNITKQLDGNYVRSPEIGAISKMIYGLELETIYPVIIDDSGEFGIDVAEVKKNVVTEGMDLDICPSIINYKVGSSESAGINISNSISKTYQRINELGLTGVELKPIKVKVTPILSQYFTLSGISIPDSKKYQADNAYYHPVEKEIVFLPQSQKRKMSEFNTPFWQMPMVGAHEYGHHVFNTLFVDKINKKVSFSKNCFQGHSHASNILGAEVAERDNTSTFAIRSINEGFADLIAKYSLDENESSMRNIKCFEKNRDPRSLNFGAGAKKIFDAKATSIIDNKDSIKAVRNCDVPNLQEIHNVGAYFAYSANKIIESYSNNNSLSLKILLEFIKNLALADEGFGEVKASDYIYASLNELMLTAHKLTNKSPADYDCSLIREFFPDNPGMVCEVTLMELEGSIQSNLN